MEGGEETDRRHTRQASSTTTSFADASTICQVGAVSNFGFDMMLFCRKMLVALFLISMSCFRARNVLKHSYDFWANSQDLVYPRL